ncbi:hypothetical protein CLNEO_15000 [Anaerotignum neopropionicum]|uniref:Small-conductance mechanosensitive channel n=1 Tax=Anaerotignum neopropionicum TaxID=36847 RepID=A0A136WEK4_9FIRM|nr:hypothetical protein [Anaerotignum neopropionicum]KXL52958.1 hypothetical protein CLNEO_15000 [Anaerotignum neopropionicum]
MSNVQNTADIDKRFYEEYTVKMIKRGRLTTLLAALLTFIPALYLWLALGFKPSWSVIGQGWAIIVSSYLIIYFVEPLGFYPVMGLSGIYIGYLAGNIPSVRLPAMISAQVATGCEAGTKKGELVGTIAIGMSVFVNLAFVTFAAITGVAILNVLPPFIVSAFNYTLPAILGGVIAQYFKKNKIFVPLILTICVVLQKAPLPSVAKFPSAILLSFVLGYFIYKSNKK